MVATPILAEIANSSAISARLNPGNCWRVSAQNQRVTASVLRPSAATSSGRMSTGNNRAAPTSRQPKRANPAASPLPTQASTPAQSNNATAAAPCTRSPWPAAIAQARGRALLRSGMRAICQSRPLAAASAPMTAMASPDSPQEARKSNAPETSAP